VQTLLTNAFIYTADETWQSFAQGALLVDNDRIAWVGDQTIWPEIAASRNFKPDHILDLRGAVVIPGLINAHAHGGLSAYRGVCDEGDLFQWATVLAPHTANLVEEDLVLGCYLAIMAQVASGTTCTCDCTRYGVGIFARVATTIGLRSVSGALVNSSELRPQGRPNWPSAMHETEAALAEFSTSARTRFFLGAHSPYNCTAELLVEVKKEAERLALPFNIHVAETQKEVDQIQAKYGLRPVEWLESLGVLDQTTLIDHAVWLSPTEIDIVARRGASVAHCPISNAKLASGVAPIPELRRQGVVIGLGTDSTLSHNSQNLFEEMKFAVLVQRANHLDGHILTARGVLRMATLEAAEAIGWADEIGSLSPGKQADLVVLRLAHPQELTIKRVESDLVYACGPNLVQTVMVGGEIIYDRGRFTRFDPDIIHAQIEARYQKKEHLPQWRHLLV
jgi:5-methylthioadenosine/S-adenosylhomocysteine deaminase